MHAEIYTHAAPFVDADISGPPLGFLMQRVVIMHLDKPILVLNVVLYLNADQSRPGQNATVTVIQPLNS